MWGIAQTELLTRSNLLFYSTMEVGLVFESTSMPNLIEFCNEELGTNISPEVPYVNVGSVDLSLFPFIRHDRPRKCGSIFFRG